MKIIKKSIFFTLVVGGVQMLAIAQKTHFQHFNERQGLSNNYVSYLYQDSVGFLWVGSAEGLNRYDGKEFRVFRHLKRDSNSLSDNFVNCIFPGQNGKLWIGTESGLNCFDPDSELFHRYYYPDNFEASQYILSGICDSLGFIWYGTYNGLFRLNAQEKKWKHFPADSTLSYGLNNNAVWSILEVNQGEYWVGTSNGLVILEEVNSFEANRYFTFPGIKKSNGSLRVFSLEKDENGAVWMGTRNGLVRAEGPINQLKFSHFENEEANQNSLSHNFIWDVLVEPAGPIWAASYGGGLNRIFYDHSGTESPQFFRFTHDEKRPNSLAHAEVQSIIKDKSGIVWVGTTAGLDKIDPANERFQWVKNVPNAPYSLRSDHVQALTFDHLGNLWLGTRGGGLHRLLATDLAAGDFQFEVYEHSPEHSESISHNDVFGLYEDQHGILWINTYDGLDYCETNNNGPQVFHHFDQADGLAYKFQYQTLQRKNGEYWIATYANLNRLHFDFENPRDSEFETYNMDLSRDDALVNATTHTLSEDRFGQLWIGTFSGLSKLVSAEQPGKFENYLHDPKDSTSLSNNFVRQLYLDHQGRLWAATRGGLNYIHQTAADQSVTFQSFGAEHGFPSENVMSILEEENGKFWLSTSGGIVLFDTELALRQNGRSPVVAKFDYRDGLQGNEFVDRAATIGPDGKFYFGGINGLTIFDPNDLWENPFVPPVVFTEFRLFNELVSPSSEKGNPLKKSISRTKSLTLNHRQNVIGFSFAALSFSQPEKNQYAYLMEGFDNEWIFSGNENAATYTNLAPGNYKFKVKASNSNGVWNLHPIAIDLKILPPPWLTWWAYSIYFILAGVLIYLTYQYRLQQKIKSIEEKARIQKARFEEREMLRKQNAADFHDELGHRLTKISLFLELAERQKNNSEEIKSYLRKVRLNAAGLSAGIRDLIWTLDPKSDSLGQTIVRLREFGDVLFERSGIDFQSKVQSGINDKIHLAPDVRKHLLLLFKEAMNNCLKHSKAKHCIFQVNQIEAGIHLQLIDNGKGFVVAENGKGYGVSNMQSRAEKINGELIIDSKIGGGASISLKLKMPHMGYSNSLG